MQAAPHLATILVVEDSIDLVALLQRVLAEHGYRVRSARDGDSGLALALEETPDLLIVDVGLPRRDGFAMVRELRSRGLTSPMLMLTARGGTADKITGLDSGADDYLVKPFDPDELAARVRALLRRASNHGHVPRLRVGNLVLDPVTRDVYRGDRALNLTAREFSLLEFFMRNAGVPVTRAAIAAQVWRQTPVDVDETNIIDVYVNYLRKKLDSDDDDPMLHTIRGLGYVLRATAAD